MPDHVHLVLPAGSELRLRRVVLGFSVRFGVQFDLLPAEPANSPAIAGRQIRYGFFNPQREGIVQDPWQWPWSTLRDLSGAIISPWTALPRIAAALHLPPAVTLRALTRTAHCTPAIPRRQPIAAASIETVTEAVCAALRLEHTLPLPTTARRLTVQALYEIGSPNPRLLASALHCSERSLRRDRFAPPSASETTALDTVLLCIGDPRLRQSGTPWPPSGHLGSG